MITVVGAWRTNGLTSKSWRVDRRWFVRKGREVRILSVERECERDLRDVILGTVEDMVSDLLYYHRKDSEALPVGAIEAAIDNGVVTVDEIIETFGNELKAGLEDG
jgi:hypothetical protein